jgi:ATP adenylyltransferase
MPERLWAPWRFEYIKKASKQGEENCIFVDLPAQEDDRKNLILYRGKTAFVIMNAFPYTNGHLMVAPYKHVADLEGLNEEELLELHQLIRDCVRWLTMAYQPEGFNIGANLGKAAGAGIEDHLHYHVVPRWLGDTNYMPVIGEVRVLPQSLEESYDAIRRVIEEEAWT